MRQYKSGQCRKALTFLPPSIDQYIDENHLVRALEDYVESLDMAKLGFRHTQPKANNAGQPSYHPKDLLKLYLWGVWNKTRSGRELEKECHRNLEVMWLLSTLTPSYKTITDFRKHHGDALVRVNRDFHLLCEQADLFGKEVLGIDSAFFEGNAAKDSFYNKKKLKDRIEALEQKAKDYHEALDHHDQLEDHQEAKIKQWTEEREKLEALQTQLEDSGDTQIGTTDPDARLLNKNTGKGPNAGYNVQIAVDNKHKLIAAFELVNDRNDQHQLMPMVEAIRISLGIEHFELLADCGYFLQQAIKACLDQNISIFIPVPKKCGHAKNGQRYRRSDFIYLSEENEYECPASKRFTYKRTVEEANGRVSYRYQSNKADCEGCPLADQCLTKKAKTRNISRWEHEHVIEQYRQTMAEQGGEKMRARSGLAEHPFGTMKLWLGWTHFLTRGFEKVRGEAALLITGYNFRRVINILGVSKFRQLCAMRG